MYSDIFRYPLTAREVFQNIAASGADEREIQQTLDDLCENGIVHKKDFFYTLHTDPGIYESRLERNKRANKFRKQGERISRFISWFPFTRAVFLSGSLSKDCMEPDGDIDYFIITSPNRLWVARTFLIVFKKIALFNSYKFFCLNYFIDEDHLEIQEKNIYTATEIVTLIPTFGKEQCQAFMDANQWARDFRPHFPERPLSGLAKSNPSFFKGFLEWLLGGRFGNRLENYFLKMTTRFWQRKFKNYSRQDYQQSIKSQEHRSQINPENFQKRVLLALEENIKAFERKHDVSLNQ